jgi:tetratricopeptide (TPR) repeat protein
MAIKDFTRVIGHNPRRADAFDGRAWAHCLKKKFDQAIADATEAIRLNPPCASAFCHRSRAHAGKGERAQAVADAAEAIRLEAKPAHYEALGLAHYARGEYDLAIADFSEAIKLDPRNGELFGSRARAYAKKGDSAKAQADRHKALKFGTKAEKRGKKRSKEGTPPAPSGGIGGTATVGARVRNKALELLSDRPDGIRYSRLVREIHHAFPDIPVNTIHGNVWDLNKILPDDIYKPARGVFRAVKFRETGTPAAGEEPPGVDRFGTRLGTRRARANAVLSPTVAKTMEQIQAEAGIKGTVFKHMKELMERGIVVKEGKGFRLAAPTPGSGEDLGGKETISDRGDARSRREETLKVLARHGIIQEGSEIEVIPESRPEGAANQDQTLFRARIGNVSRRQSVVWLHDNNAYSLTKLTVKLESEHGLRWADGKTAGNWRVVGHTGSLWQEASRLLEQEGAAAPEKE